MKPFNIEISEITKGPDELSYQLPVQAKVLKQIPGKDRPDYFLVELEKSVFWVDEQKDINTEINYLIICSKKKGQSISNEMKDVILAIAYVTDESVKTDSRLNFKKCEYVAVGKSTAKKGWKLFN